MMKQTAETQDASTPAGLNVVQSSDENAARVAGSRSGHALTLLLSLAFLLVAQGCAGSKRQLVGRETRMPSFAAVQPAVESPTVALTAYQQADTPQHHRPVEDQFSPEEIVHPNAEPPQLLEELESWAIGNNPTLRRMQQEAAAEWAKAGYVDKLPDPTIGTMFFGNAMNFVPDSQLAEVQVMQMIPWLGRLRAESQQAQMEALAAENLYQAERLRIVGDLRATWFKLYVLGKQIATTEADKAQLQSLITTANARVSAGDAQPGDVLMATLELSSLQEQLLNYHQQIAATTAELNRLVGRESQVPIAIPNVIDVELPQWNHELLRQIAMETQPELNAARLRTAATRWGIEVARLKRRPDLTFGAGWMVMGADPADTMPGAGDDAWTLGVTASVPLWHGKYDAMLSEASRKHNAAHASEDEVALRLDALLRDLWEQARAGQQTVELYEKTILPQARQTFEADQKSLINGTVTFDRVIRDYRTLLNLELGYHRALGQLATTLARIRQTVGVDLLDTPTQPRS
jgi:cobalt-zinc-cadmium efflux system outer membrane protein